MVAIATIAIISVCHQLEKLNPANNFPQLVLDPALSPYKL